ncbi:hypothetical protein [Butyrivibrio sp. X503]|uniref:hypothetical protein n=1 Tax=Butyrivibrio sp. X503 TaxID=2364878 RepID=UPI0011C2187A|nr:hypothetical protein [Butyrivibrio sp. X503]
MGESIRLKKIKIVLLIIMSITLISGAILFILKGADKREKEKILENANKNGYMIEFADDSSLFIEKQNAKFYYNVDLSGVFFDKCDILVEEKDVKVKEGDIVITIKDKGNNFVNVSIHDSRILIKEDGTEEDHFYSTFFTSNDEFDESSLVISEAKVDDEQKSKDAYKHVMDYLTPENLKDYYNQAKDICDHLNEK